MASEEKNEPKERRKDRKKVWQGKTVGVGEVFYSLDIAVGHCTSGFVFPSVVSVFYIFCRFPNP